MRKLIFTLAALCCLMGCREYAVPELNENVNPIFNFQGEIDGVSVNLKADGAYKAFSGYSIDSLGVTVYEGWLAACEGCPAEFHFKWRASSEESPDLVTTTNNSSPIIRQINRNDSVTLYEITLDAESYASVSSYNWSILGMEYSGKNVVVTLEESAMRTKIPVKLDVNYINGCVASITDTVYLPNHGCDCEMNIEEEAPLIYNYSALANGGNTYAYRWRFENGEEIPSKEITYQFPQYPTDGVEEIELSINTGDCQANRKRQQFFSGANTGCAANFTYQIEAQKKRIDQPIEADLGQVSITYLGDNGVLYRTEIVEQTPESFFKVSGVKTYRDPFQDSDKESVMINAEFNCILSNGEEVIRIRNANFVLPVGLGAL